MGTTRHSAVARAACIGASLMGCTAHAQMHYGARIGDLDLSGDGQADLVEIVAPRLDIGMEELLALSCTCDAPWVNGRIEIRDAVSRALQATILAESRADALGRSVSATADLNGDGAVDLIVGASRMRIRGEAYVFFGPFSGGEQRRPSQADLVLRPPSEIDHEFGHMVGPMQDLDGDGVPEIRVRASRGRLALQNAVTHLFDGASGAFLIAVESGKLDDMWRPIEGDLDDDGDVDAADLARLIPQIGRTQLDNRLWADMTFEGEVENEDLLEQLEVYGFVHSGLDVARLAVDALLWIGVEPCAAAEVEDCYVYVDSGGAGTSGVECCTDDDESPYDCIRQLPDVPLPGVATDCLSNDPCFDEWKQFMAQQAGGAAGCNWPPTIHYVDCSTCDDNPGGFYDPGTKEIWICLDEYPMDTGDPWADDWYCQKLKETVLEEMLHALQDCYSSTPGLPTDTCASFGCHEFQAGRFFDCMFEQEPCTCAIQEVIDTIDFKIGSSDDPDDIAMWQDCKDTWEGFQLLVGSEAEACELLELFCGNNGIPGPYPTCQLIPHPSQQPPQPQPTPSDAGSRLR